MGEGREEIQQGHAEYVETALGEARATTLKPDARRMGRIQRTGAWLSVIPSTVNGTELGVQEWRESLFLCYIINPPDMPFHCDGCLVSFSICHSLEFQKGGLIMVRNNDLRDGVADLARKAFTPVYVRDDPKIFTGRAVHGLGVPMQSNKERQ